MWNLVLVRLEIVSVSVQDRCRVCAKQTIGSEIILDAPMELLGDVGCVESRFSTFGGSVSVGARKVHYLHQTYRRLINHFGRTRRNS
jgi:hypothetical protein